MFPTHNLIDLLRLVSENEALLKIRIEHCYSHITITVLPHPLTISFQILSAIGAKFPEVVILTNADDINSPKVGGIAENNDTPHDL